MTKFKFLYILILLFIIPLSSAGRFIDSNEPNQEYSYAINNNTFNSLPKQIIINVPHEVVDNVQVIDGASFRFGRTTSPVPNQNLLMRVYITHFNKHNASDDFFFSEGITLPYTFITNYGGILRINFNYPITLNHADNESVSFGFFSTATTGSYYILGNPTILTANYVNAVNYYPIVKNVTGQDIYGNDGTTNDTVLLATTFNGIFGSFLFPPTPLPTPTATSVQDNGTLPCLDCNSTLPGIDRNNGTAGLGYNFSNSTNACPTCQGNETSSSDQLDKNSAIGKALSDSGYCSSSGCNTQDIIDALYDFSIIGFEFSFILLLIKFVYIFRKR